MFDSMWQMSSQGGCWFICLDSPECCGGVDASWDTHWNLGNLLLIWSWIPIKENGGMLGVCLPWWGEAPSVPRLVTYWLGIELPTFWLLSHFDIRNLNANMPNRKSHRSKKRTLKWASPARLNRSSGPPKWTIRSSKPGWHALCQIGRHQSTTLRCLSMEMYKILNTSIWDKRKSVK